MKYANILIELFKYLLVRVRVKAKAQDGDKFDHHY